MIDLLELERKLDAALAAETKESLTQWLNDQRNKNLQNFLGSGHAINFNSESFQFKSCGSRKANLLGEDHIAGNNQLAMAA